MARSIDRKLLTAASQLKDALRQINGAARYVAQGEPILLTARGGDIDLYVAERELISVALIREIFPKQSPAILAALKAHRSNEQCLIVLDYPGFATFAHHFPQEDRFVEELMAYSKTILEADVWITANAFVTGRALGDQLGE